jgi:hypothetical protein
MSKSASRAGVNAISTDESRTREIAKSVVRRNATGNVRLQLGDFVDKTDLDRQFERIKKYRFVSD